MDSLKNNVLDHDNQIRPRPRSASRREMSGPLLNSNRNRSGLQYRSNTAPSSFWSDDDEVDDQDSNGVYDADEEEHQGIRHRHKVWRFQEILAKTGKRLHRKALKTREVIHYVGRRVNLVHRPTLRLREESGQRM
ncbi:hypothetical protein BGX20_003431 [Mortierella sp. AD010]|nr:hypothetical protein BGX20_003431 [Mortierella sp. AD010]